MDTQLLYRPAQLRSEVKRAARDAVMAQFGLTKHASQKDLVRNRTKVKILLRNDAFTYKARSFPSVFHFRLLTSTGLLGHV
jgi:hypothetical protein